MNEKPRCGRHFQPSSCLISLGPSPATAASRVSLVRSFVVVLGDPRMHALHHHHALSDAPSDARCLCVIYIGRTIRHGLAVSRGVLIRAPWLFPALWLKYLRRAACMHGFSVLFARHSVICGVFLATPSYLLRTCIGALKGAKAGS
ncbi:hypothetical protein F5X97DRAFT_310657 [Nemania serpens]|nr:hypothetical protein F5X97DRAFT_310657 [Nemania serpens]